MSLNTSTTSSRRLDILTSRRLQDVLEVEKFLQRRRLQDIFKTCLEDVCLQKISSKCLQDMP